VCAELCLFDKVQQKPKNGGGSTDLGRWSSEASTDSSSGKLSTSEWKFTEGLKCWGGPSRSTTAHLRCGADFAASDASEPNRCEYAVKLETPTACSQERVAELESLLSSSSGADASGSAESAEPIEYI
jgi:protein kinase C substrate 80K-H